MELMTTPISNLEVDLHIVPKWRPEFIRDIHHLRTNVEDSKGKKLMSLLITSHLVFLNIGILRENND